MTLILNNDILIIVTKTNNKKERLITMCKKKYVLYNELEKKYIRIVGKKVKETTNVNLAEEFTEDEVYSFIKERLSVPQKRFYKAEESPIGYTLDDEEERTCYEEEGFNFDNQLKEFKKNIDLINTIKNTLENMMDEKKVYLKKVKRQLDVIEAKQHDLEHLTLKNIRYGLND